MRMRPALAASFAALASAAVVATVLTAPGTATATTGTVATAARTTQSGVTQLSAPIVQPGRRDTRSSRAELTGTVRFRPAYERRPVTIQRRVVNDDGTTGSWKTVTRRKREDRHGRVTFTGAAYSKGDPFEYRGVARRWHGHRKVRATPQSAAVWKPVFTDEFSGSSLGEQWTDRPAPTSSRRCSRVGDPRASQVRYGTLRLQVKLNPKRRSDRCRIDGKRKYRYYLNGAVSTQHFDGGDFQYGTFSARIKFPKLRGQHGGFWMQPTKGMTDTGNVHTSGAEIDVVEFFGKSYPKGGLASFLYNYSILDKHGDPVKIGGLQPDATRMLPRRDSWWSRYHVFTVEWTPNSYSFQVDGRQHYRTKRGVSRTPEYLILSQLTSDWELKQARRLGIRPRGTMKVDWARVWQK